MEKLLFVLTLLFVGCEVNEPTKDNKVEFRYVKDDKTNLCFIDNYTNNGHLSVFHIYSNVPCTPEVEKAYSEIIIWVHSVNGYHHSLLN